MGAAHRRPLYAAALLARCGNVDIQGWEGLSAVPVVLAGKLPGSQGHRQARRQGHKQPPGRQRLVVHCGYTSADNRLFSFRLLEWRRPFSINPPDRGYFDLAGMWSGQDLVLNRPDEQGKRLNTGPFIDHATITLRWTSYGDFESACRNGQKPTVR